MCSSSGGRHTCWQLLHTSLHSLSTSFSFMTDRTKDNNPCSFRCRSASDPPLPPFPSFAHPPNWVWQAFCCSKAPVLSSVWIGLLTESVFFAAFIFSPSVVPGVEGLLAKFFRSNKITSGSERITFCLLSFSKISHSSHLRPPSRAWHRCSFQPNTDGSEPGEWSRTLSSASL